MFNTPIPIDHDKLLTHLEQVKSDAEGDVARMLELLLLEVQVLRGQRSSGLLRGASFNLSTYPRFVELVDHAEQLEQEAGSS